jgi:hypothetical protein
MKRAQKLELLTDLYEAQDSDPAITIRLYHGQTFTGYLTWVNETDIGLMLPPTVEPEAFRVADIENVWRAIA